MIRRRSNLLALSLAAAVAAAGAGAPDEARADEAEAKVFERKGKQAYSKKRWDEAAAAFQLAYEAEPKPKYLFNAAKAFEQGGDLPQAIELLQRYVKVEDDVEERADGKAQLKILQTRLKGSHAKVTISSKPAGAQVLIEGNGPVRSGLTPWQLWLPAGQWRVKMIKAGFQPMEHDLITQAGAGASLKVKMKKPAPKAEAAPPPPAKTTGKLRLSVSPAEGEAATLQVDGEDRGALPQDVDLAAGRHLVEVRRKGYRPWSKWIELKAGDDRMLELAMAKLGDDEEEDEGSMAALPAAVGLGALGAAAGALGALGGAAQGAGNAAGTAAGSAAGGAVGGAPGAGTPEASGAGPGGQAAGEGQGGGAPPAATQPPVPAKKSAGEKRAEAEGMGRLPSSTALLVMHTLGGKQVTEVKGKIDEQEISNKEDSDIDENYTAIGFRFGDLINPFVDVGASLYAYIHNSDDGADVSSYTFGLSPFLRVRVPIVPGPHGDMLEVYGLATGGLLVDSLTEDGRDRLKEAGVKADDINFGWTVGGAAGAQLNLTRNLGFYAEGGFNRGRLTIGVKEVNGERLSGGESVVDLSRPFVGAGLIFLN